MYVNMTLFFRTMSVEKTNTERSAPPLPPPATPPPAEHPLQAGPGAADGEGAADGPGGAGPPRGRVRRRSTYLKILLLGLSVGYHGESKNLMDNVIHP